MIKQTINDAAPVVARVLEQAATMGVHPRGVNFNFESLSVHVTLTRGAAERADEVWRLLMDEFRRAGWGYGTYFGNGHDQPRTEMTFSHPTTLTRWR